MMMMMIMVMVMVVVVIMKFQNTSELAVFGVGYPSNVALNSDAATKTARLRCVEKKTHHGRLCTAWRSKLHCGVCGEVCLKY